MPWGVGVSKGRESWPLETGKAGYVDGATQPEKGSVVVTAHFSSLTVALHGPNPTVKRGKESLETKMGAVGVGWGSGLRGHIQL